MLATLRMTALLFVLVAVMVWISGGPDETAAIVKTFR